MNPIIAIDFNGALLRSRPFDEAHTRWFRLFSVLLDDDAINEWAFKENYFEGVHDVMKRYLGNVPKDAQVMFAREIYALALVAEVSTKDLVDEFVDYLRSIKEKYTLALITTTPEVAVDPLLQKIGCRDVFDIIFSSQMKSYPDKRALFEDFIVKYERPLYYIGEGDKDVGWCRDLEIKSISVNWANKGRFKGEHNIDTVDELKDIL
jgi:FMN phosphatase YigB (HAD superfamily)